MIIIYCLMILVGLAPVWLATRYILPEEKIRKHGYRVVVEINNSNAQQTGATTRTALIA